MDPHTDYVLVDSVGWISRIIAIWGVALFVGMGLIAHEIYRAAREIADAVREKRNAR